MKPEERRKSRELRRQGKSVREIEKELDVSRSSVSRWVRDIELTPEQEQRLWERDRSYAASGTLAKRRRKIFLEKRKQYQESGREKAKKESGNLFQVGCMLYWAEGGKGRNDVRFSNSDVNMMNLFLRFLRECYKVKSEDVSVYINCYTNNGLSVEQIEKYWIEQLRLKQRCLRKTLVNCYPRTSRRKTVRNKLIYGICRIVVCRTDIVQSIYGAIQEYGDFENEKWLD